MYKNCKPVPAIKNVLASALVWGFSVISSFAQQAQYVFSHLTTENGLMNNYVHRLFQDSRGYMWIGSINGLQRFDGNRFINYTTDLHDTSALHYSLVNVIFEDSKHRFWVGASEIYQLNRNTGKFYNYNLHASPGTPVPDGIQKIMEDNEGGIWILNRNGYYKLNDKTNQFTDCSLMAGLTPGESPSLMDKDEQGNIWFVTSKGIKYYNTVSKKLFDRNNNPGKLKVLEDKRPVSSLLVQDGTIWVGYFWSRVLYQYNFTSNILIEHPVSEIKNGKTETSNYQSKIENIGITHDKKIRMVLPGEGIAFYDPANGRIEEIAIDNNDPNGLHCSPEAFGAVVLFEDRQGNTWISGDKGLNIFDPGKIHFNFYGNNRENKTTLPAYPVNGFVQDPLTQDIYVAYYYPSGGIIKLNKDLQFQKQYLWRQNSKPAILENQIWSLHMDENGVIWAPNQAKTILKLDTRTDQLSLVNDSSLNYHITCFQKDNKGDLWMGSWQSGLKKMDKNTHTVNTYMQAPPGSPFTAKTILCLYFEADSIIWAGSNESGLFRFNKQTGKYTDCYFFDEKNPHSISNNVIKQIIYYNKDTLLLATNMGLDFFDTKKRTFSHLSSKDGLPGDIVESIETDNEKNIWAACDGGLCKINMHPFFITSYGLTDGITDDIFNNSPFFKTQDGKFLVAASKGFVSFRPADIVSAQPPVVPVITGFKLFDKNIPVDSLLYKKTPVSLSYKENSFTIEFASLQFNVSGQLKYYYRLDGVDDDWVAATNEQAAHYNHLQSGNYNFRVKCISRDGHEAPAEAVLSIIIRPPFWKTWWFTSLVILLMVSVFYMLFRWLKKRRKEKEQVRIEYEKRIAAMEMNTLRAQMNPHFIFNSLNSINDFILSNDPDNASGYLTKFSRLIRLILDNSRTEWVLLENELKALELYIQMEMVRFENIFSYQISLGDSVSTTTVLVPPLIIQPYVENAIWHGLLHREEPGGKLSINIWKEKNEIKIQVQDNGVGRTVASQLKSKASMLHKSHGMKITAERLEIINTIYNVGASVIVTDLADNDGKPSGTRILLTMKYKTHDSADN